MALHLIKLCVGCDSIEDLAAWQVERLRARRKAGERKPQLFHRTFQTPKRRAELLDGGSLYWVIKGYVRVRHRILDLKQGTRDGVPHCGIVYHPKPVQTELLAHRPFQGWRYLDPADAPPDVAGRGFREATAGWNRKPPPELLKHLRELGLI